MSLIIIFIHGDLWYENYILDDNDELTGIIDFENAKYGDPASDISALCYLGNEFIMNLLRNCRRITISK